MFIFIALVIRPFKVIQVHLVPIESSYVTSC